MMSDGPLRCRRRRLPSGRGQAACMHARMPACVVQPGSLCMCMRLVVASCWGGLGWIVWVAWLLLSTVGRAEAFGLVPSNGGGPGGGGRGGDQLLHFLFARVPTAPVALAVHGTWSTRACRARGLVLPAPARAPACVWRHFVRRHKQLVAVVVAVRPPARFNIFLFRGFLVRR